MNTEMIICLGIAAIAYTLVLVFWIKKIKKSNATSAARKRNFNTAIAWAISAVLVLAIYLPIVWYSMNYIDSISGHSRCEGFCEITAFIAAYLLAYWIPMKLIKRAYPHIRKYLGSK